MKKIFCIGLITLFCKQLVLGQVNISPLYLYDRVDPFKPEIIAKFKSSTMAFFYRKNEEGKLDEFKKAFSQMWNLTKVEFVSIDKLGEYEKKPNYSYFAPTVFTVSQGSIDYVYGLWLYDGGKRYKIADIPLKLTKESHDEINSKRGDRTKEHTQTELMPLYASANFVNLLPGYFKMYVAQLNMYLKKGEPKKLYKEVEPNETEIKNLKEKTLYVPKAVFGLTDYGSYYAESYGLVVSDERVNKELPKLFKKYPAGKIKPVSEQELSDLILNATEDIYFLQINLRYSTTLQSYIGVINAKTGEPIYTDMRNMLKLKPSHFEGLIKKINGDFSK
jgi:hypothetical protein